MAYSSHFRGELFIEPPLPWSMIMDSRFLPLEPGELIVGWGMYSPPDVIFTLRKERENTVGGVLIKTAATSVAPREERMYGYELYGDLQTIADMAPGHTFTGRIDRLGVDGDQSRYKITNGIAREFSPLVTWPEGSE